MLVALIGLISVLQQVIFWLILARIIVSWMRVDPYHPAVRVLHDITEPLLAPIRRLMPSSGMFDLSPMVLLFAVQIVGKILKTILISIF